jgi:predicted transcriptional regulator
MEYRNRSRIEAAILKATANTAKDSNSKGLKHREIMHKTAIPDIYLKAYMQLLYQKELIEYDNQRQVFRITEKGIHYLNLDNEINDLLA